MSRVVSWFSCGAASAVATKLALADGPVDIVYCQVAEEHPDNMRFLCDCEDWFGQDIKVLRNQRYQGSIYEVFKRDKYLVGTNGARCTLKLKKELRQQYERPTDRQVLGYTVEEQGRIDRFIDANNDVDFWPILVEAQLTKADCLAMIKNAGIKLPAMYELGYRNNNCIGCVKGGAGYWNKIRRDFPKRFDRMAKQERELGVKICKETINGTRERVYLDELSPDCGDYEAEPDIDCGIFCYMAEQRIAG